MRLVWCLAIVTACVGWNARAAGDSFERGLAQLRTHVVPEASPTNGWRAGLRILVGVDSLDGTKQSVRFVELTTTKPPLTNSNGKPWMPVLETNGFVWVATNGPHVTNKIQFVWSLYPVQVRIFDESGRQLKDGMTTIPFGLLTNGLAQVCRMSVIEKGPPKDTRESVNAFASGFLWMGAMMGRLETVPELKGIWDSANCCFRWPSLWTMTRAAFGGGMMISIEPDYKKISLADPNALAQTYLMPMDMVCNGRVLTRVETVIGPATGASQLLGGVEFIQARHPIKTADHKFTAKVLAVGLAR